MSGPKLLIFVAIYVLFSFQNERNKPHKYFLGCAILMNVSRFFIHRTYNTALVQCVFDKQIHLKLDLNIQQTKTDKHNKQTSKTRR